MKIFGKSRETLRIKKIRASRAVFMNEVGTQEIEITMLTEDGEKLTLQLPPQLAGALVQELSSAYEAIAPPLRRGFDYMPWDGQ